MFQQLHDYFFRYKRVAIPAVGTFEMVQLPALLDVANKLIAAPSVEVRFSQQVFLPQHQLQNLALALGDDVANMEEQLNLFGISIISRLQRQPIYWKGVGELQLSDNNIRFKQEHNSAPLLPVAAQKVLRENMQHTVLIGDQEVQVSTGDFEGSVEKEKSTFGVWAFAWILLFLTAAFIIYLLFTGGWQPGASGLRQKVSVEQAPLQHQ